MSEKELKARIQQKHDVEANWINATGFSPKAGEIIVYDADENNPVRFKIGDGVTNVNLLPFATKQFISYLSQQLTAEQQLQARQNIGIIGEGANGYSIYKTSVNNLQEVNFEIPIAKVQNNGRTLQVGDYIYLSDLSHTLTVITQIKTDSVVVASTNIHLKGTDGMNGLNGISMYTFRKSGTSDPDGYYDPDSVNLPSGHTLKNGDLLVDIKADNYDVYQVVGIPSVNQMAIEPTGMQLKGPNGDSITISSLEQNFISGGTSSVTFSDGNILSIKNGEDGKNGTSVTIESLQQTSEAGANSIITFSDGKTLLIRNGEDGIHGTNGRDGYSGVYVGSSTIPATANVQINPNGDGSVFVIPEVLQTTGSSEVDTMSQKAITELLSSISGGGGNGEGGSARSIVSITRTSGNGTAGTTDTYTITYTDGTTSTFTVYNGKDGVNGKSAYESAKSGGYTGTEANFNTTLNNITKYSTETWTFTLEDDSTVTKKVVISS